MTRIKIDWLSIAIAYTNRPKNLTAKQFFETELPKFTGSRQISRSSFYRKLSQMRQQLHTDERTHRKLRLKRLLRRIFKTYKFSNLKQQST